MANRGTWVFTAVIFSALLAPIAPAAEGVPNPVVSAPVTGGAHGQPFGALTASDLRQARYTEAEHFFSGSARAYEKDGTWGLDGIWRVTPAQSAGYKVRLLVRRPVDARRFSGVVVIEWLNVTAMAEGAADYMQMNELIEREGHAWVGIGAQASGVNAPRSGLKAWDPERYSSLMHPGDAYSYDIFSQAAQAVLHPESVDPLGGLKTRHLIATGRSQSAFRLVTYLDAFHAQAHLFNGWVVEVPPPLEMGAGCKEPINTAPHHAVVKAALSALITWVKTGQAPPQSPAIEITDPRAPDPIARDAIGNARGGIRLPELEAPTAILDGRRNDVAQASPGGQNFCFLFGHTMLIDERMMKSMYPSHDAFVRKFDGAVDTIVRDGYWLKPEGEAAKAAAAAAHIGQ